MARRRLRDAALAGAALFLLAGCSLDRQMTVQPLTAEDMPVLFGYGSLARGTHTYSQAIDRNFGTSVKRMVIESPSEWAIVDVRSTVGNYVFRSLDPKKVGPTLVRDGSDLAWGPDGGTVRDGAWPVNWHRFTMADTNASCLALVRNLANHNQAGLGTWSTQLVGALYCRNGGIAADEVPAIARSLRARA